MRKAEHAQRVLAEALRDTAVVLTSSLTLDEIFEGILDQAAIPRSWGSNASGQLGEGTKMTIATRTAVKDIDGVAMLQDITSIESGGFHTCARTTAGALGCWGSNGFGQLGIGQ